jgi:hypothetical protein
MLIPECDLIGLPAIWVNLSKFEVDLHPHRQPQGSSNLKKLHFVESHYRSQLFQPDFRVLVKEIGAVRRRGVALTTDPISGG